MTSDDIFFYVDGLNEMGAGMYREALSAWEWVSSEKCTAVVCFLEGF
jgi:hypothetical protein